MYACPSCQQRKISFLRKWWSWPASPAQCPNCHSWSAIATVSASGTSVAAIVIVTLSGFAAVAVHSALPLLGGVTGAIAFYFWLQHRAALINVSEEEMKLAKRSNWLLFLAFLFPIFFS